MTHRESKAISDRINRKADRKSEMHNMCKEYTLDQLVSLQTRCLALAKTSQQDAAHYAKAIRKRKMEAKKLTGSGDERRTRIADGPETGGHVEASAAVDGVPSSSEHGRRRPGHHA